MRFHIKNFSPTTEFHPFKVLRCVYGPKMHRRSKMALRLE